MHTISTISKIIESEYIPKIIPWFIVNNSNIVIKRRRLECEW